MLMEWREITVEQLAEQALLSVKTIQRMRSEQTHKWSIETLAVVCVGLRLPPYISTPLIEKAGLKFMVSEKDVILAHLLATRYKSSIFEFNEYMEMAGFTPLSGKE